MSAHVGQGRGKVILFGEHAVVYGHPALAGALALGMRATATPASADRLRVPAWGVDSASDPGGAVARAFAALREALEGDGSWDVVCEATVPPRAGLGSSAALAVAVARAIAPGAGAESIEAAAQAAERVFHGNPSGVDVAIAARGGIGMFHRGKGLTPLAVAPFRLALGLTGEARDTAARVADVARRRERDPRGTDLRLGAMGELAREAAGALEAGAPGALVPLLARAQVELSALGLSSVGIDRLCAIADWLGAGAKLTGAGGGGAVIAVLPGGEERLVAAWRKAGFEAHVVTVGVSGGDS